LGLFKYFITFREAAYGNVCNCCQKIELSGFAKKPTSNEQDPVGGWQGLNGSLCNNGKYEQQESWHGPAGSWQGPVFVFPMLKKKEGKKRGRGLFNLKAGFLGSKRAV